MKRLTSILLCLTLITATITSAAAATDSATVQSAVTALGIITGDGSGNLNLTRTVTRAEFAKMMVAASVYKDTVTDGSGYSPFKDVKSSHWAAGYIKAAVDAKWMIGYTDGNFRPDATITFEEAASAILKMLGFETSDLAGSYPGAQITKFRSLKLDSGVSPAQGRALTRHECMYFFYNLMGTATKSGSIYGVTLGYTINSAGEIDYDELVKADIEGPFIMKTSALSSVLPFETKLATVYRNSKLSTPSAAGLYDVVYYNVNTKQVWVYSDRAIGVYTAVSPSAVSPTSVTVGGNTYSLETSAAKAKLSATGEFAIGDTVALLLGMNGTVVDVISASEIDAVYAGVVTSIELSTYATGASASNASYTVTVACTDGITRESTIGSKSYSVGNVVTISYAKGEVTVRGAGASNLTGKFSSDGKKLDNLPLSEDVEIMEISSGGDWKLIRPSRLAGATIERGDVRYHVLNERQEISLLILNDVTGDLASYGIITTIEETAASSSSDIENLNYRYVIGGISGTYNSSPIYGVTTGPALFSYKSGQISGIKNLTSVSISELSALTATGNNKVYKIGDEVQVYLRSGSDYSLTALSAVDTDTYKLTGYYESIYPAGGQLRVIIAEKR